MIVIDASAMVEVLLRGPAAQRIVEKLAGDRQTVHAPHLIDLEVAQVLRRFVRTRQLDAARSVEAIEDFVRARLIRYPHKPLLPRIWELRHAMSAYDAAYVALAESLAARLLTRDGRLAATTGHRVRIDLV